MDMELSGRYVLAHRKLLPAGARGGGGPADPIGGVRCGRPLVYPVPVVDLPVPLRRRAEALGGRYVGVMFAFDLDSLPPGRRYTSVRFEVTLTDPRALAVQLDRDGDGLGLASGEPASATAAHTVGAADARPGWLRRLASRQRTPRARVTGAYTPHFGWVYDDPGPALALPRTYGVHALLEIPAGVQRVDGAIGAGVRVATGRGQVTGGLRAPVTFAEPLTPSGVPAGAAVRLCMAADVAGYHRRDTAAHERIQARIADVLDRSRRAAGVTADAVRPPPQGDGQFTVLPVGIDESAVIPRLVQELTAALREPDDGGPEAMRLRVALHRGVVKEGAGGWIGEAPAAVHRFLDSRPVRAALDRHVTAHHVLAVPDVLYRDVLLHAVEPPLPDHFTPITVDLPEKGFIEHGWLHVGAEDHR